MIVIYAYIRDTWLLRKCYDELTTLLLLFMVLMFEWVLKFRIWVLTVIIGTYVYGILVIDGYLCPVCGMITRLPQSTQPSLTLSSTFRQLNGSSFASSVCCLPCNTIFLTDDNTGSRSVHCLICVADTGEPFSVSMSRTVSPGRGMSDGISESGSL